MSISAIRNARRVPAKRGGRVRYWGSTGPQMGTIKSARNGYLRILLDGDKRPHNFHPTWQIEYLDENGLTILDTTTGRR